jgi:hypothetical protein
MKCMSAMEGNGFDGSMLTRWCQVMVSYLWKKCTTFAKCKIYLDNHVRGLGRVTIWFQQLVELG